jgi:hypothetical protein
MWRLLGMSAGEERARRYPDTHELYVLELEPVPGSSRRSDLEATSAQSTASASRSS